MKDRDREKQDNAENELRSPQVLADNSRGIRKLLYAGASALIRENRNHTDHENANANK